MTTLVLGASGFVGRALVRSLTGTGETVRAASRTPREGDQWVTVDLEAPETLAPALENVDYVYYLVHSMGSGAGDFRATERQCAAALAHAAANAGVRRIIYLGGVAPRGEPSEHLASRLEVGQILRAGSVPTIELRASMIIGTGSASWQILRDLAVRLPIMLLPRWLESKSCPIALADAITALRDARTVSMATTSDWFDIPGNEVLSFREMLELVAALDHRRIPAIRVPVLTPRLSALWLRLVTRTDYSLARELVLGLGSDLLPESREYWNLTGHPPVFSFRQAAEEALTSEPKGSRAARVVEGFVKAIGSHRPDA
ncbi:MAG: NAD(P)H-binding protein [Deltaproteobacteria bacterium]|nr:NAD(P)H-binding protein [Deltaproteobacteria bacterium]